MRTPSRETTSQFWRESDWTSVTWFFVVIALVWLVWTLLLRWREYKQRLDAEQKAWDHKGALPDPTDKERELTQEILAGTHIDPPSEVFSSLRVFDKAMTAYIHQIWASEMSFNDIQRRCDLIYRLRLQVFYREDSVQSLPIGSTGKVYSPKTPPRSAKQPDQ